MENVSTTRILRFSLTFTLGNDNYHEKIGEISVTGTEKAKKKSWQVVSSLYTLSETKKDLKKKKIVFPLFQSNLRNPCYMFVLFTKHTWKKILKHFCTFLIVSVNYCAHAGGCQCSSEYVISALWRPTLFLYWNSKRESFCNAPT